MDACGLAAEAGADREAGKNKEGKTGDTKGASRANRGISKGAWKSKGGRGGSKLPPSFLPVSNIAILSKPVLNARV